jgi:methylenetetrahydrofolate reductase (NADPH)
MKVTQHIEAANGETLFSKLFRQGKSIQELYDNIDPLMEFKPPFIDVTLLVRNLFMLIKAMVY